ncbi:hypothetical protein CDCA_CDCA10G3031 [Cyanidium caldarium]|uniref:Uncharacterized protein n=1 Tax=Cyanidium caldarium TaxID=2771 RepID=A0AAV9IXY3_CYACA|nr:hypothetical protein CDCA_CDCA10G3031 [Cyanidium caldarium]
MASSVPRVMRPLLMPTVAALAAHLRPRQRLCALDLCGEQVAVAVSDRERRLAAPFGIYHAHLEAVSKDVSLLNHVLDIAREHDADRAMNIAGLVVNVPEVGTAQVPVVAEPPPHLRQYVEALVGGGVHWVDTEEERARGIAVIYWSEAHARQYAISETEKLKATLHEAARQSSGDPQQPTPEGEEEDESRWRAAVPSLVRRMLFGYGEGAPHRRERKRRLRKERQPPPSASHLRLRRSGQQRSAELNEMLSGSTSICETLQDVLGALAVHAAATEARVHPASAASAS